MKTLLLAALLVLVAAPLAAQKPKEQYRWLQGSVEVDSVAAGRVYYLTLAHEDPARVGQHGSMTQSDWNFHALMTRAAPIVGDAARGQAVYQAECQRCHTTPHGTDFAEFHPSDSLMLARGIPHVQDTAKMWDVIAYVHALKLTADTMDMSRHLFQPGGVILPSDSAFGVWLFGKDEWPATLTRDSLLRMDPTRVPISLALFRWSDPNTLADWVPGTNQGNGELPVGVQAAVKPYMDAFNNNPSDATALALARNLQTQVSNVNVPDAPCTFTAQYVVRFDPIKCGDAGKWWGLMLYKWSVQSGRVAEFAKVAAGPWWEIGHLYHKAQQMSGQGCGTKCDIPERSRLILGWIYLGWQFDLALNKNSTYMGGPMGDLNLNRLATWSILRTQVSRPSSGRNASLACFDAENNAIDGAVGWLVNAQIFAYNEITRRALAGQFTSAEKTSCVEEVRRSQVKVGQRAGAAAQAATQTAAAAATAALKS